MQKIAILIVLLTSVASSLACSMFNQLADPDRAADPGNARVPTPVLDSRRRPNLPRQPSRQRTTLPALQPTRRASPQLRGPALPATITRRRRYRLLFHPATACR